MASYQAGFHSRGDGGAASCLVFVNGCSVDLYKLRFNLPDCVFFGGYYQGVMVGSGRVLLPGGNRLRERVYRLVQFVREV